MYMDETVQMKAKEQCFLVVLYIVLYKMVLTLEFVDEILSVTIETNAIECTTWFNFRLWLKSSSVTAETNAIECTTWFNFRCG